MAEIAISRAAKCVQCDCEFQAFSLRGPTRKRCEPCHISAIRSRSKKHVAAWYLRSHGPIPEGRKRRPCQSKGLPHPCGHCGQETTRPTYCSIKCSAVARQRRLGIRPKHEVIAESKAAAIRFDCLECLKSFRPTRSGDHRAGQQKFCSRDCSNAESRRGQKVREEARLYARWAKDAKLKAKAVERINSCRDCYISLPKAKQRCEPCRKKRQVESKARQKLSATYRARKNAAKARRRSSLTDKDAERFDPFEIFDRDGWRCHMCRCSTPKRYRGTIKPNAPELDHIVPLSKGGKHTRANTACSCRACNGVKSDRIFGQPSLLALAA
jgi:hypothetical protein